MSVVTLTFISSEEEISSGIPKTITIESNIPATIYFTLDGSTPTTDSAIYVDTFELPTGYNSVVLSAFGVDSFDEVGPTLIQTFAPDVSNISVGKYTGTEGIILDDVGEGDDTIIGYDADGEAAVYSDIDELDLEIIKTDKGYLGIAPGTEVEVNFPLPQDTPSLIDDNFAPFSTPEIGELFNPQAKMIVIDNRISNDLNIMPRPWGSLNNITREFGGKRLLGKNSESNYVSGGFVRRFYSATNGIMVSYYFDHNQGRYVKNIQNLPNSVPGSASNYSGPPLVFKWLRPGTQSGLI